MKGLKSMLLKEQQYLETICSKAEEELKSSPDGCLRVSKDKYRIRYYHCTTNRNGTYISSNDMELVRQLAQKKYNQSILKKAEIRLKQVKKITRDYSDDEIEQIYDKLHKERQLLVMPIEPTWEQKLAQWDGETYQGKEFYEGTAVIITEKGGASQIKIRENSCRLFLSKQYYI